MLWKVHIIQQGFCECKECVKTFAKITGPLLFGSFVSTKDVL
jgi:hypothetical protein